MKESYNKVPVLLLTGTIDSGVYNNTGNRITDIDERLSQYEKAIERYIKETPFQNIVFIDNSGYPFQQNKFIEMAHQTRCGGVISVLNLFEAA